MNSVMIVDDNMTLARLTARNLERDIPGLNVLAVSSCREARQAVETLSPSVVVADLTLEDGNGVELFRELSQHCPGLSGILISGEVQPESILEGLFAVLMKPYEADTLTDLVIKAIETGEPGSDTVGKRMPLVACGGYRSHYVRNLLGDLILGLRVLSRELKDQAHDPAAVCRLIDRRFDDLCKVVMEVSSLLPLCPKTPRSDKITGRSPKVMHD